MGLNLEQFSSNLCIIGRTEFSSRLLAQAGANQVERPAPGSPGNPAPPNPAAPNPAAPAAPNPSSTSSAPPPPKPESLDDTVHGLMVWGGIIAFLVIGLFIAKKVFRWTAQSRLGSFERPIGMTMDDLDSMGKTGLLSKEEQAKIRQAIARQMLNRSKEEVEKRLPPEAILAQAEIQAEQARAAGKSNSSAAPSQAAQENQRGFVAKSQTPAPSLPNIFPVMSKSSSSSSPTAPGAVDLNDLLARGLISLEEYERLQGTTHGRS